MKTEANVLRSITKWLDTQDCEYYKVHGSLFQRSGEPDLTGSIEYKNKIVHFKFEVKSVIGKVSRVQEERMKAWSKYDILVGVVRSVGDVISLLDGWVENDKK